jgi:hypothetical protein
MSNSNGPAGTGESILTPAKAAPPSATAPRLRVGLRQRMISRTRRASERGKPLQ